jgi:Zn-finger nucleic acid-binding protein
VRLLGEPACPACGDKQGLSRREAGPPPVELLECDACGGFWLDGAVLQGLVERARREPPAPPPARLERPPLLDGARKPPRAYRSCPRCGTLMRRQNYAQRSGVVLDVCEKHGAWFDLEELDRLLGWVHAGGEAGPKAQVRDAQWQELRRRARRRQAAEPPEPPWYETLNDSRWIPWAYFAARLLVTLLAKR